MRLHSNSALFFRFLQFSVIRHAAVPVLFLSLGLPLWGLSERTLHGRPYYSLKEVGSHLGMDSRWKTKEQELILSSQWTRIGLVRDERSIQINEVSVYLGWPLAYYGKELWISKVDFEQVIRPILTPQVFPDVPRLKRIIIDAGHGGKDPGAINTELKLREKYLAVDLAKRLQAGLEKNGYQVVLTRSEDVFIGLEERCEMANREDADLFVSLHFNAAGSPKVRGVETYAFTPQGQASTARSELSSSDKVDYPANRFDSWNCLVAYYVQRELAAALPTPDRGLRRARFAVLKNLNCPGILVESGFVTHPTEGRNIGSWRYRQKIADAILEGILTYQRTLARLSE